MDEGNAGVAYRAADSSPSMKATMAIALLGILMLAGHVIRAKVAILRRLFLPASLIAGLLGLALLNLFKLIPGGADYIASEMTNGWDMLPSILTNLVFACLVLGQQLPSVREVVRLAGPQLAFGQIVAFGQYGVTSLLAAAWFETSYNVSKTFAAVVPLGFEGGHGVVAGFKEALEVDNPDGYNQGMVAATIGLLSGTIIGWAMVNWGYNSGKLSALRPRSGPAAATAAARSVLSTPHRSSSGTPVREVAHDRDYAANDVDVHTNPAWGGAARSTFGVGEIDPLLGRETPGFPDSTAAHNGGGNSTSTSTSSGGWDGGGGGGRSSGDRGSSSGFAESSSSSGRRSPAVNRDDDSIRYHGKFDGDGGGSAGKNAGSGGVGGKAASPGMADGEHALAPGPRPHTPANNPPAVNWEHNGVYKLGERPVAGFQTVATESLDTLALHLSIVGLTLGLGWVLKTCTLQIQQAAGGWLEEVDFFGSFPLFPFTLGSAVVVQAIIDCLGPATSLALDRATMNRISGTCMDFLVLSAIATLDFSSLSSAYVPFFVSCGLVVVWSLFALFCFGPLIPDMWLERATVEVGLSCGATATALLVLRMVDPHSDTVLLKAFCYKQIAHVCLVGGGIFTSSSLTILRAGGNWTMFGIALGMVVFWLAILFGCSHRAPTWCRRLCTLRSANGWNADETTPLLER